MSCLPYTCTVRAAVFSESFRRCKNDWIQSQQGPGQLDIVNAAAVPEGLLVEAYQVHIGQAHDIC